MIIDTSAVLAILLQEKDARLFAEAIAQAVDRRMSAANLVECSIVLAKKFGRAGGQSLDLFLQKAGIHVEPVSAEHARLAREAYSRFGKGLHPAGLNFGDVFAYALAVSESQPLLFKGDDFDKTDVQVAARSP